MDATSPERTYRYLRITVAGSVVVMFTAIGVSIPRVGLLPSISHYYYTPARLMFASVLVAVSLCFFALSGRGAERVLLDAAAVIVPLVAIVPTTIAPGSVPGLDDGCHGVPGCVPAAFDADVDDGILTYLIVGVLILLFVATLAAAGQVDRPGTALSAAIAAAVLLVVWLTWWLARDAFLRWAHAAAAVGFFGLTAVVAAWGALAPRAPRAPRRLRVAYVVIAVALAAVLVGMPAYGQARIGPFHGVFLGEVVALLLFAAFWVLQSVQYWDDADPAILAGR